VSGGRRALVLLFVLTLPLVTPRIRAADEIQYFAPLRSLVFDHDLDYENEYRYFYERDPQGLAGFRETFLERREAGSGRHINFAPLGSALLWSPFYLAAHAGVVLARAAGAGVPADGFSFPYLAAVSFASAFYAFLGLLLVHDLLRQDAGVSDTLATLVVATLWLGTPVVYYMTIAPGFGHATSLFAVSLLLWLTLRARRADGSRGALAFGAIGLGAGLCGIVREQDLLFACVPLGFLLLDALKPSGLVPAVRRGLAFAAGTLCALLPQLLVYRTLTGSATPSRLVTRKLDLASPYFFPVLFDPGHGLFFWSPVLLVATLGLFAWALRRRDALSALLVFALVLQAWISGAVESWHMAGAFGARRFVGATPVFGFGLACVYAALAARRRLAVPAIALLAAWWNLSLMVQFGLKLMDRQQLDWPRVARNQVFEVPRHLVRAGVLFFTDRERLARESR
jgi:hypothetical protein